MGGLTQVAYRLLYIYVAGTFRDHVNNILVYTCNEHLYELE